MTPFACCAHAFDVLLDPTSTEWLTSPHYLLVTLQQGIFIARKFPQAVSRAHHLLQIWADWLRVKIRLALIGLLLGIGPVLFVWHSSVCQPFLEYVDKQPFGRSSVWVRVRAVFAVFRGRTTAAFGETSAGTYLESMHASGSNVREPLYDCSPVLVYCGGP